MHNPVRSILIAFVVLSVTLALFPAIAYATPVRLIRIEAVEPADEFAAAQLSAAIVEVAGDVPGWTASPVAIGLGDLMESAGCIDVTIPGVECLHQLATRPGSGAYGALLVYGFLRRDGEGAHALLEIELMLFDAIEVSITHRVFAETTSAQLEDAEARSALATAMVARLSSPSTDSGEIIRIGPGDSAAVSVPDEPVVASAPDHSGLEIAGWVLVGTAAASAIAAMVTGGVLIELNSDERYNAYRGTWDATRISNVCDVAAADMSDDGRYALGVCNDAQVQEVLMPLLWTVAGIAGVVGTALVWHPWASSASAERSEVRLAPALGPTLAGIDLGISF